MRISRPEDPLLSLHYHRHFSHALLFAPIIGLLVAALFKGLFYLRQWSFGELFKFATLGACSHGLLDACTSYGTMLYLPFSKHRESWDLISIIDPLFTIPLFTLCIVSFIYRKTRIAQIAIILCMMYLCFGYLQRKRAENFAYELATQRGITIESINARPSFANTLLWRIIVRSEDHYYVDAVQLMPFHQPKLYEGSHTPIPDLSAFVPAESQQSHDIERFKHFSQGYLYEVPGKPYSRRPALCALPGLNRAALGHPPRSAGTRFTRPNGLFSQTFQSGIPETVGNDSGKKHTLNIFLRIET